VAVNFLNENEQIFDTLFEAASEGVIVVNKQQVIVTANLAALKCSVTKNMNYWVKISIFSFP